MSSKKTKQSAYPIFAKNFNKMIGYKGKEDRKSRSIAADILEVKYENIRVWSEGLFLPKGDMLLKIKEKYGISIDWLLSGEESITCSFCDSLEPETKKAYESLKKILESDDEGTKKAILQNLTAFKNSVERKNEITKLKIAGFELESGGKRFETNTLGRERTQESRGKKVIDLADYR